MIFDGFTISAIQYQYQLHHNQVVIWVKISTSSLFNWKEWSDFLKVICHPQTGPDFGPAFNGKTQSHEQVLRPICYDRWLRLTHGKRLALKHFVEIQNMPYMVNVLLANPSYDFMEPSGESDVIVGHIRAYITYPHNLASALPLIIIFHLSWWRSSNEKI